MEAIKKLGLELEFFIVSRDSLKPIDGVRLLSEAGLIGDFVKPEICMEQVEVTSSPHWNLEALHEELTDRVSAVSDFLRQHDAVLLPIPDMNGGEFTPSSSFNEEKFARIGENFFSYACRIVSDQINIGTLSGSVDWNMYNQVSIFLPEIYALSVESHHSNRMRIYDKALEEHPDITGLPRHIDTMDEYNDIIQHLSVFHAARFLYTYIRPMPERNVAAEIRCLDKQPSLRKLIALTAFVKALVIDIVEHDSSAAKLLPKGDIAERFKQIREQGIESFDLYLNLIEHLQERLDAHERNYLHDLIEHVQRKNNTLPERTPSSMLQLAEGYLY